MTIPIHWTRYRFIAPSVSREEFVLARFYPRRLLVEVSRQVARGSTGVLFRIGALGGACALLSLTPYHEHSLLATAVVVALGCVALSFVLTTLSYAWASVRLLAYWIVVISVASHHDEYEAFVRDASRRRLLAMRVG